MIKKILVPVDGSPHSVKAVELASDLGSKYEAEIVLLHVLLRGHMPEGLKKALEIEVSTRKAVKTTSDHLVNMPQQIMTRVGSLKDDQLTLDELNFIGKYVLSSVAAICRDRGISKVHQRVEEGNPANVIIKIADEVSADMIIMGNRGLSDLRGLLVGSVSHRVSHLAKCTCVTVR